MQANCTTRQFPISFTLQLLMFAVTNFSKRGFCMLIYLWGQLYDIPTLNAFWVTCFLWILKEDLAQKSEIKWVSHLSHFKIYSKLPKAALFGAWYLNYSRRMKFSIPDAIWQTHGTQLLIVVVFTRCKDVSVQGREVRFYSSVKRIFPFHIWCKYFSKQVCNKVKLMKDQQTTDLVILENKWVFLKKNPKPWNCKEIISNSLAKAVLYCVAICLSVSIDNLMCVKVLYTGFVFLVHKEKTEVMYK